MRDPKDNVTGELVDPPKRARGRPPSGKAMTAAERKAAQRARSGKSTLTVELSPEVLAGFDEYLRFKGLTKSEVIERLLVSQLLRKR